MIGFETFFEMDCTPERDRRRDHHQIFVGATLVVARPHRSDDLSLETPRLSMSQNNPMNPTVIAVHSSATHEFSKQTRSSIRLLEGLGVEGDAHLGVTIKHRSRVAADPTQPNLRQVHLIHAELHDELLERGFTVRPGDLGENITTRGIDLLGLPVGTKVYVGSSAVVEVTGLRNPCAQIDAFQPGLLARVVSRDENGELIRKSGIMGVVLRGGEIQPGDAIRLELPPEPHRKLERV
jgi:MOSC domain-containing protein YiiM